MDDPCTSCPASCADPSVGHYGFANPVISKLLVAWTLMGVCVAIHAGGVSAAMRWLFRFPQAPQKFLASTWLFTRVAAWIILLHLIFFAIVRRMFTATPTGGHTT